MTYTILAINPGATSTKIGLFKDEEMIFKEDISYSLDDLKKYKNSNEQYEIRLDSVLSTLKKYDVDMKIIDAVVGRGGLLPPVKAGAYEVNKGILDCLKYQPVVDHASNLGAPLAQGISDIAKKGCRAFIYDPVTVDQFTDIARISGLNGLERKSIGHILNMRAVAMKVAKEMNASYYEKNFIVAHLGGGSTISAHQKGQIIDLISDDEGPFSTERTGGLAIKDVIHLCYQNSEDEMFAKYRKKGGLISYLGTNDVRKIEGKIDSGDKEAELILEALAYQSSKGIGEMAAVLKGKVDCIIITGGLAYSKRITEWIKSYIEFLAPVILVPGENELEALAMGAKRIISGEENANVFEWKQ
ncbi:butyrate kinase [Neobacillus sp. PS3-40]|uniref:butyrate kinase n=1 Tax=Neobacillus sp. PS3-40 TaxID=3070679 RepID=UPI0027E04C7A|nr:butyrate kinase [Neobacillus sp. PS3-40]WML44697.1 butyrate kinase [Neobacillus sp. PS3-40]